MNKYKKIAVSVVSIVMAGTMVGSLAACGDKTGGGGYNGPYDVIEVGGLKLAVNPDNHEELGYTKNTQINVNIIDSGNADRKISYDSGQIATAWTGVDGKVYMSGNIKPAWVQLGEDLDVKFNDVAMPDRSGKEISEALGAEGLARYNLINSSVTGINTNKDLMVNLADFMDYMPNFKHFLEEYKIVEWSLQMDENGGMYYIPYFDGNDDIEKYEIVQRDWVKVILDEELNADKAISYLEQYNAKLTASGDEDDDVEEATAIPADALAEAFMGTTGEDDWEVDTTDPDDETKTVKLTVSYGAVIEALEDSGSELYKAITAISGVTAPQTQSGNIVDIQNDIITKTSGAVKGNELAKVLREYIKVAYKLGGEAYETLSDVFVSASAGWDADLMVALFRCVVTNFNAFNGLADAVASDVYALAGREAKPQRDNDLIALAGELYGVRGMESKLDYLYIDGNGDMKDARLEEASYDAAARFNKLAKEGLLYNKIGTAAKNTTKVYSAGNPISFMLHDYVQTQTKDGFTNDALDFAPIVTPVSRWDVDGNKDNGNEVVMRFTESWRSVKNSGVCIPKVSVSNPETLSAVIAFVDYLFSNDGQIIGSYGPRSTTGNTNPNGFWYGNDGVEVLNEDGTVKSEYAEMVDTADGTQYFLKKEYRGEGFMYGNVLYQGMPYKDKQIPIMTTANKDFYLGKTVGASGKMDTGNSAGIKKNYAFNYTDYARGIVGAALPIGNKDQGFEYQCTADCGLDGAAIVAKALNNKTIMHVVQEVDSSNWWYTIVPTVLPVSSENATTIGGQKFLDGDSSTASIYNATGGTGITNVYIDLAFYGYASEAGEYAIGTGHKATGSWGMQTDAASLIEYITGLSNNGLTRRIGWYSAAWNLLKEINL